VARQPLDAVQEFPIGLQHRLGLGDQLLDVGIVQLGLDQLALGGRPVGQARDQDRVAGGRGFAVAAFSCPQLIR